MDVLSNSLAVYVTADTAEIRQKWSDILVGYFGYATVYDGSGVWAGGSEPVTVVVSFVDNLADKVSGLLPILAEYKQDANQEAVGLQINSTLFVFYTVDEILEFTL